MKRKIPDSVLLIIPVILFVIVSLLRDYQGPYYTNTQYDPAYVYLISSLNLSQFSGYEVIHVDHPGTPVQVIGALVIRAYYFLNGQETSVSEDVLLNPEAYLLAIFYVFLIINCLGLFVLGRISYIAFSNIKIFLLLQLLPFTSVSIYSLLTYDRPENFLVFVACLFISVLILFINDIKINSGNYLKYVLILGIISGLGIATKITFFPLLFVPLILFPGMKPKLLFLLSLFISLLLFVSPVISGYNINYFSQWVYDLIIHNNKYGRGDASVIDPGKFLSNIKRIFMREWFFDFAYVMIILSLLFSFLRKYSTSFKSADKNNLDLANRSDNLFSNEFEFRLILGLFAAMTVQILIVAKHYGDNYMFPALTFSVFSVFISLSVLTPFMKRHLTKRMPSIAYTFVIVVIIIYASLSFYSYGGKLRVITAESAKLLDHVKANSAGNLIVTSMHVASPEFALFTAIGYSGSQRRKYEAILSSKFPDIIFYKKGGCYYFDNYENKVVNALALNGNLNFLCTDDAYLKDFIDVVRSKYKFSNITTEKTFSNKNGEMIYEVKIEN